MATALTATLIGGVSCIGDDIFMGIFTAPFQTTDATGICTVDLTDHFSYVHAAVPAGNDTLADNGYKYDFVLPTYTTAITATNVAVSVYDDPGAGAGQAAFAAEASTDLTATGDFRFIVYGKQAI